MSEVSRIIGVFFEPKKAFEDIVQQPRWIVPLVVILVASLAFVAVYTQHVGWERMVRQQMANSSRTQQLTPEQREQGVATGTRIAPVFAYGGIILGVPISYLIMAGVLLGIGAGIMSAPVKFKQVFAVVCYSGLPGVVFSLLAIVVMFLKNPDDFNIRNPLVFNVGALMDEQSSSKFLYSLATSIDVFSFWMIFLIATGLKGAAGKKLSYGGALLAVILPWGVYVLCKSALAGMFS